MSSRLLCGGSVLLFVGWVAVAPAQERAVLSGEGERFQHHFGDADLQGRNMGQTDLVDLTGNGKLDFITGEQRGTIYWYEYRSADDWVRHVLGRDSPSDVGGAAMDVNGNGRMDFVAGGAWYENPGNPTEREFVRHLFDSELNSVHDIVICSKPWTPNADNGIGGRNHFSFLENLSADGDASD